MPINQNTLNSATRDALQAFCHLLPTMVGPISEAPRGKGFEFTIANPCLPNRPLTIGTVNGELTAYFAASHYHISDYGQGRMESELIEDMILGIAAIIGGSTGAYSSHAGDRVLGGGFITVSTDQEFSGAHWSKAGRFVIYSWDGSGDNTVERPATA